MVKKQTKEKHIVKEPDVAYNSKQITFFNSFEEMEDFDRKEMAKHTPLQHIQNLEIIRKRFYHAQLLPNGCWPPLEKIITVIKLND